MTLRQETLDAFQATSLILVFVTVFFNIKYPLIIENLNLKIPEGKKARQNLKDKMKTDLIINNLPTMILNGGSFYLFFPLTIKTIKTTNFEIFNFNILSTAFLFIEFWIGIFFIWSAILLVKTIIKIKSINIEDSDLIN
ncbi:MAG: hypothetical protein AWU54_2226 [Candidatus Frackibacter sp. T328-2]|nr:MAG: hypothetical protein AWU54_2226 [Candidatus Frackibacter sp. T328-2]